MISRLGLAVSRVFQKTAPDPFVIAVLLTVLTLVLALAQTDNSFTQLIDFWADETVGLWALLGFGMQMCLILVTGHALASSPPVSRLLDRLASLPRSGPQAAAIIAAVAAMLAILNWGLGLIGGALIARRVGQVMHRRGIAVHYPLLAASGYVGLMVWHGGFSGSAPLKVTTTKEIQDIFGADAPFETIPLTETILSPMNLFITGGLLIIAPLLMAMMSPTQPHEMQPMEFFAEPEQEKDKPGADPDKPLIPRLLEDTPIVTVILVSLIAIWAWRYYFPADLSQSGIKSLTPNTVNLTMLMLGLILHGTPRQYVLAIEDAARGCAGIILQFPLYAGIMGVMKQSGLTAQLAREMASTAHETTLPLMTFVSAGVINLFVPSGGGQWAIQGPIAMHAAVDAGVAPAKMVMAVAYGDQLTNMLQPFWALPLLAITGVRARDIVGYTALLMIVAGAWMALGLVIF